MVENLDRIKAPSAKRMTEVLSLQINSANCLNVSQASLMVNSGLARNTCAICQGKCIHVLDEIIEVA